MRTKLTVVTAVVGALLATCLVSGPAKATSMPVLRGVATPGIITLVGRGGRVGVGRGGVGVGRYGGVGVGRYGGGVRRYGTAVGVRRYAVGVGVGVGRYYGGRYCPGAYHYWDGTACVDRRGYSYVSRPYVNRGYVNRGYVNRGYVHRGRWR
jgi:hypothetical protein